MVLILSKSHSHRKKAEECRAMADASPQQREHYLELASMWDLLAVDADIRADFLRRNPPPQRRSGAG
jgi:hypothetical protein